MNWTDGALITLALFLAGVIFKMGHHSARLESLEEWRRNIRLDMHEISEKLDGLTKDIDNVKTLIEERTERRLIPRQQ